MTLKTFIYFITAMLCFEWSMTVYRLNRRAAANRLYAAGSFFYAFFSLAYVQMLISPDAAACRAWYLIYTPLYYIVVVIIIHFLFEVSGYRGLSKKPLFLALLYGSGICIITGVIYFAPVVKNFYKSPGGWWIVYDLSSPWTWFVFNYSTLLLVPAIAALYSRYRNAAPDKTRQQAGMIMAAATATAFLSLVQNLLTLLLPVEITMLLGDTYFQAVAIFFIGIMRFAIWKYRLMTVEPASSASEIFSSISNAVFLADGHGDVVFMNNRASEIVPADSSNCGKLTLTALFRENESFQRDLHNILSGRTMSRPVTLNIALRGLKLVVELCMYPLIDESGCCAGVLAITRQQPGLDELQRQAGLTERELEVLLLIGGGLSAGEIANECEISLQTAKSHIHNIYHKTGLKNRVDLTNLLNKHS